MSSACENDTCWWLKVRPVHNTGAWRNQWRTLNSALSLPREPAAFCPVPRPVVPPGLLLPVALIAGASSSALPASSAAASAAAAGLPPAGAALLARGLRGSPGGKSSEALAGSPSVAEAPLLLAEAPLPLPAAAEATLGLLPNSSARSAESVAAAAAEPRGVPRAERSAGEPPAGLPPAEPWNWSRRLPPLRLTASLAAADAVAPELCLLCQLAMNWPLQAWTAGRTGELFRNGSRSLYQKDRGLATAQCSSQTTASHQAS